MRTVCCSDRHGSMGFLPLVPGGVCLWSGGVYTPSGQTPPTPWADTPPDRHTWARTLQADIHLSRPPRPVHAGIHPAQCTPPWTKFLTYAYENITFPQVLLRTVKIAVKRICPRISLFEGQCANDYALNQWIQWIPFVTCR